MVRFAPRVSPRVSPHVDPHVAPLMAPRVAPLMAPQVAFQAVSLFLVREAVRQPYWGAGGPGVTELASAAVACRNGDNPASGACREGSPGAPPVLGPTKGAGATADRRNAAPTRSLASVPDPFNDADALEELGDRIATLAAHIHAATHRLLVLIADFDRRRGWELGGHRTCAHWLSFRTGMNLGAAREKVRTARALVDLPRTGAAMARGELSFSQVRALSRVATADTEGALVELARGCTTAQLERMVRGYRRGSREDEAEAERERHARRCLSVFPDEDGMYVVRGRLPAEVGALLMRAVEAAGDALYRERKAPWPQADSQQEAARLRADALGLLAERALAVGFGGRGGEEGGDAGVEDEAGNGGEVETGEDGRRGAVDPENGGGTGGKRGEAGGEGGGEAEANAAPIPISGTRAERYQVVLHVEAGTLEDRGQPGRSELEDGTRVSAATSRRLSCDAGLVRVTHAPDGSILDVGRRTRTIPPALRRALEYRDRGCRFPGCGSRFTDAHHVKHWADGGETKLGNTILLCAAHHRLVHEGGWVIRWCDAGRAVFFDRRGGAHFEGRWQPPGLPADPVESLLEENRSRGATPGPRTAGARWKREADIPDPVYLRAQEALLGAGP